MKFLCMQFKVLYRTIDIESMSLRPLEVGTTLMAVGVIVTLDPITEYPPTPKWQGVGVV